MCLCVIFFVKEHEGKYGGKRNREGDREIQERKGKRDRAKTSARKKGKIRKPSGCASLRYIDCCRKTRNEIYR